MADLTLFHTADVHVATFDTLAPVAQLTHVVRPDWLARAQGGIDAELRLEITSAIQAATGPVLCSCTTIGEAAEEAGATRIDWPMMQRAAQTAAAAGGPVLLVYCLDSTKEPSTALLQRAFAQLGASPNIQALPLSDLWPLFEAGDRQGFNAQIATRVQAQLDQTPDTSCVVLAQASMAGAKDLLQDRTSVPVFASPAIAVETLLAPT
ncbi:aspartate/glutamate racemase family protein [Pseudophaeobacter leonis]|uniref:aspartate/glutamate racemase family protein n=1 Tax=Pseudophaeobacter leonis TaxID=1144477 RepID=UPI0009F3AA0F|nr:aspartate/glutamate racemase family protein [Pseudophaeobacter leonis]